MTTNEASNKSHAIITSGVKRIEFIQIGQRKKHDISYNALLILYSLWNAKHYCAEDDLRQWMLPKQTVNTILKGI